MLHTPWLHAGTSLAPPAAASAGSAPSQGRLLCAQPWRSAPGGQGGAGRETSGRRVGRQDGRGKGAGLCLVLSTCVRLPGICTSSGNDTTSAPAPNPTLQGRPDLRKGVGVVERRRLLLQVRHLLLQLKLLPPGVGNLRHWQIVAKCVQTSRNEAKGRSGKHTGVRPAVARFKERFILLTLYLFKSRSKAVSAKVATRVMAASCEGKASGAPDMVADECATLLCRDLLEGPHEKPVEGPRYPRWWHQVAPRWHSPALSRLALEKGCYMDHPIRDFSSLF